MTSTPGASESLLTSCNRDVEWVDRKLNEFSKAQAGDRITLEAMDQLSFLNDIVKTDLSSLSELDQETPFSQQLERELSVLSQKIDTLFSEIAPGGEEAKIRGERGEIRNAERALELDGVVLQFEAGEGMILEAGEAPVYQEPHEILPKLLNPGETLAFISEEALKDEFSAKIAEKGSPETFSIADLKGEISGDLLSELEEKVLDLFADGIRDENSGVIEKIRLLSPDNALKLAKKVARRGVSDGNILGSMAKNIGAFPLRDRDFVKLFSFIGKPENFPFKIPPKPDDMDFLSQGEWDEMNDSVSARDDHTGSVSALPRAWVNAFKIATDDGGEAEEALNLDALPKTKEIKEDLRFALNSHFPAEAVKGYLANVDTIKDGGAGEALWGSIENSLKSGEPKKGKKGARTSKISFAVKLTLFDLYKGSGKQVPKVVFEAFKIINSNNKIEEEILLREMKNFSDWDQGEAIDLIERIATATCDPDKNVKGEPPVLSCIRAVSNCFAFGADHGLKGEVLALLGGGKNDADFNNDVKAFTKRNTAIRNRDKAEGEKVTCDNLSENLRGQIAELKDEEAFPGKIAHLEGENKRLHSEIAVHNETIAAGGKPAKRAGGLKKKLEKELSQVIVSLTLLQDPEVRATKIETLTKSHERAIIKQNKKGEELEGQNSLIESTQALVTEYEVSTKLESLKDRGDQVLSTKLPCLSNAATYAKYKERFGSCRQPDALLTYVKTISTLENDDERDLMLSKIDEFVDNAVKTDEEWQTYRYSIDASTPHLAAIGATLLDEWKKGGTMGAGGSITIKDTDDPIDLLLMGTEGKANCLSVDGKAYNNKCLLANVMAGKNRLITLRNKGNVSCKALYKILLDQANKPVILFEGINFDNLTDKTLDEAKGNHNKTQKLEMEKKIRKFAWDQAQKISAAIGGDPIPFYEKMNPKTLADRDQGITIKSLAGRAPFEKPDATSHVEADGAFSFKGAWRMKAAFFEAPPAPAEMDGL